MSEGEQTIRNPFDLLICDTDALLQIFCSNQEVIFRKLRTQYGITSAVTEAVEVEMLRPGRKLGNCSQQKFRKALESGLLILLEQRNLGRFTTNDPSSTYDSIQLLGQEYNKQIDRGEAHTFAASHILRAAVLSNDERAFRRADAVGIKLGKPALRAYDLFVFMYQCGELSEKDCDGIRKSLYDVGDKAHSVFAARKFVEGIPHFYPRIVNPIHTIVGSEKQIDLGDLDRVELIELKGAMQAATTVADPVPRPTR